VDKAFAKTQNYCNKKFLSTNYSDPEINLKLKTENGATMCLEGR